jgi:hypothetical protein
MGSIIEDYLREVDATLQVDAARKRAIVDEMRAHLREKVDDLARDEPARPREDIERQVVGDFGNPRDLALAYGSDGTVVNRTTGEVVLEVGRAVGRGTGRVLRGAGRGLGTFLKWAAVAVAILLVLSIGVGVWAFYELKPLVEKNAPVPVLEFHETCREICNYTLDSLVFLVHDGTREVRFDLDVRHAANSTGVVTVRVANPNGTAFEQAFPADGTRDADMHQTFAPLPGEWRVTVEFVGFTGRVALDAWTVGLPPGAV